MPRILASLGTLSCLLLGVATTSRGQGQPARATQEDLTIVYWYKKGDPAGSFQYKVYDNRKSPYPQVRMRDWMARMNALDSQFEAKTRPIHMSSHPGRSEDDVIRQELGIVRLWLPRTTGRPAQPAAPKDTTAARPKESTRFDEAAPKRPPGFGGTSWASTDRDGTQLRLSFGGDGSFSFASKRRDSVDWLNSTESNFRWQQSGGQVILTSRVSSPYEVYTTRMVGEINDGVLVLDGTDSRGKKWTYRMNQR